MLMSSELKIIGTRFFGDNTGGLWVSSSGAAMGTSLNFSSAITTTTGNSSVRVGPSHTYGPYGNSMDTDLDKFFEDAKKARDDGCLEKLKSIEEAIFRIKELQEEQYTIYKEKIVEVEVNKAIPYDPKPDQTPHRKKWATGKIFRPCIYILFDGDEIVYVGQSKSPYSRLSSHQRDKHFNAVRLLPCLKHRMSYWEKKLIKKYSPKLNKTHNENKVTSIDDYREAV
tara:strand:- start:25 stop:702 length:678 start_codon:yes stop_codon:yes gene_type:complete